MVVQDFFEIIEDLCSKSLSFVIGNSHNKSYKAILMINDFGEVIYIAGKGLLPVTREHIIKRIDDITETISSIIITSVLSDGSKEIYGFYLERCGEGFVYKTINASHLFAMYNTNMDKSMDLPKMNVVYCDINGDRYAPFELIRK